LHSCGIGAVCVNQSPGYRCDCPAGYSGDGRFNCEPVAVRTVCSSDFDCTNNAQCVNGDTCICREGFEPEGALCVDVDECFRTPGLCGANSVCANNPGGFSCNCQAPMVGAPPASPCRDPCTEVNCGKHASCQIEGSEAFCVCEEGWTYNPREISAGCVGEFRVFNVIKSFK
jgi:hypothetical protein